MTSNRIFHSAVTIFAVVAFTLCMTPAFVTPAFADTTFDSAVSPDWNVGSGQYNVNFAVDTNSSAGVQTALRAERRFTGTSAGMNNVQNRYFAETGESAPGLSTWNFDFHVNLDLDGLSARTINDVNVSLFIDFDPAVGNPELFELDLTSVGLPGATTLIQDSQNLGFGFWQSFSDPAVQPIDPFAEGEYEFLLVVSDNTGVLSESQMFVSVIPAPAAALLGMIGLPVVAWARRRMG